MPINQMHYEHITQDGVKLVLSKFIGEQQQIPPIYSAKNIDGQRAYQHARKGNIVQLKSNTVHIYSIDILNFDAPYLQIKIKCSKGTYIRSLAHDIGQELGCGAHLIHLRRTACGIYDEKKLCNIDNI
jgi:tRNA pseudouridine55 synthase